MKTLIMRPQAITGRSATHIYFWLFICSFIFAASLMADATYPFAAGLSISLVLFCLAPVYLHFYILEKYFNTNRYISYILVLLSIIIISAFVCYYFFSNIFGVKNNFLQWTVDIIFVLIITTAIKFVRNGFQQKLQLHELKTKQLEAELNFLKSQINPHFLFNMLNNLYALSLDNSKKVPEVILKLSDLMRYMLKASSDKQVQLQDECTFLKNYLELEKLRLHNNCHVTSNFSGDLTGKIITPMLLIPFAENSFKHGSKNKAGAFYIHIELIVTNNRLLFRVENSKDEKTKNHEQKPISHVGLSNIKKRLELSYPDKHKLSINDNKYTYSVELELQL